MKAVAFQPLPFRDAAEVVQIWNRVEAGAPVAALNGAELVEIQTGTRDVFAHIGGFSVHSMSLRDEQGNAEPLRVVRMEVAAFRALDIIPTLGRPVNHEPAIAADNLGPVWLSSRLWQSKYGGRTSIVGERILLATRTGNRVLATVEGVMPPDADVPHPSFDGIVDLWAVLPEALKLRASRASVFFALGRLQPGRDVADAQAALNVLADRRSSAEERRNRPTIQGFEQIALAPARQTLGIFAVGVGLVVLLAFANLASLSVAEGNRRQLELSIRTSLGASSRRLWLDIAAEHLALTTFALGLGLLLAWLTLRSLTDLVTLADIGPPIAHQPPLNLPVMLGFACMSLVATLVWSALLVRQAGRHGMSAAVRVHQASDGGNLRTAGRRAGPWRLGLLSVQACVGVTLMVLAVSLTRTYVGLTTAELGPAPDRTLFFSIRPSGGSAPVAQTAEFNNSVMTQVRSLPYVRAAAFTDNFPPFGSPMPFWKRGDPAEAPRQTTQPLVVSNDYFQTLGIPLLFGRGFSDADRHGGRPVAIIDLEMARLNWVSPEDAVNAQISVGRSGSHYEVVGVVDSFGGYWAQAPIPTIYFSQNQKPSSGGFVILRTDSSAAVVGGEARRRLVGTHDRPVVSAATTLRAEWQATATRPRARMVGMMLLGLIGLALGVQGVYALASSVVATRRLELALRIVLGAPRWSLVTIILRQIILAVVAGCAIGVLAILAVQRLAPHWLSVALSDPATSIILAMAIVLSTAFVGGLLPAKSATRSASVESLIRA